MALSVLDIFKEAHSNGPAIFQGGQVILGCVEWDQYNRWREIDSSREYSWEIDVAIISHDPSTARVRQTIKLDSWNKIKKHEAVFAFRLQDIENASVKVFSEKHPCRKEYSTEYERKKFSWREWHGAPAALILDFAVPISVRRSSLLPFTDEPLEAELAVYTISLWFAREGTANYAKTILLKLRDEARNDAGGVQTGQTPMTPQFNEVPLTPPGTVRRD